MVLDDSTTRCCVAQVATNNHKHIRCTCLFAKFVCVGVIVSSVSHKRVMCYDHYPRRCTRLDS